MLDGMKDHLLLSVVGSEGHQSPYLQIPVCDVSQLLSAGLAVSQGQLWNTNDSLPVNFSVLTNFLLSSHL